MTARTIHRLAVALALASAAALPAAASAAPPWSPPTAITPPAPRIEANTIDQGALVPRISAGSGGTQLATWLESDSATRRVLVALDGRRRIRVRTSQRTAASVRYARTRILHLDARRVGDYRGFPTVRLAYRVGKADLSSFGSTRAIGGARTIRGMPVLAVNEAGAAVAAWRHVRRGRSDEIQIATRPAGGRFGPVRTVQRDDVETETSVGVGVDAGGRGVVAYARETVRRGPARLAVRVVDTRTGRVRGESRVAPPPGQRGPTEIAVGAQPRTRAQPMVVAWRGYPVTEGPTGTIDTAAAVLPAGGGDLDAAQPLAAGRLVAYPRGPIVATVDAAGRPVVAWGEPTPAPSGQADQARSIPLVAQAGGDGRFGAPQQLDAGGSVGALVPQDEGLAVGWLRETPGIEAHGAPLGVFVARRGPDGPFGSPELVDDRAAPPGGTTYDGLQAPGLGLLPSGGLVAVYADLGANARRSENRVSTR